MAVLAEAEEDEVEDRERGRRRAEPLAEERLVALRSVRREGRDGVDVLGRNRDAEEERVARGGVVPLSVALADGALVAEEELDGAPGDELGPGRGREAAIGGERGRPSGERRAEAAALGDRLGRADGEELGDPFRERRGRREDGDLRRRHGAGLSYGRRQRRPSRARSSVAASGPHVPDS